MAVDGDFPWIGKRLEFSPDMWRDAIDRGEADAVVRALHEGFIDVGYRTTGRDGDRAHTILSYAAVNGLIDVVDTALSLGADPSPDVGAEHPALLIEVLSRGHHHVAEILIHAGARLRQIDVGNLPGKLDEGALDMLIHTGALIIDKGAEDPALADLLVAVLERGYHGAAYELTRAGVRLEPVRLGKLLERLDKGALEMLIHTGALIIDGGAGDPALADLLVAALERSDHGTAYELMRAGVQLEPVRLGKLLERLDEGVFEMLIETGALIIDESAEDPASADLLVAALERGYGAAYELARVGVRLEPVRLGKLLERLDEGALEMLIHTGALIIKKGAGDPALADLLVAALERGKRGTAYELMRAGVRLEPVRLGKLLERLDEGALEMLIETRALIIDEGAGDPAMADLLVAALERGYHGVAHELMRAGVRLEPVRLGKLLERLDEGALDMLIHMGALRIDERADGPALADLLVAVLERGYHGVAYELTQAGVRLEPFRLGNLLDRLDDAAIGMLLDFNVLDLHAIDTSGFDSSHTLLSLACEKKRYDLVGELLARGADHGHLIGMAYGTPLTQAVVHGDVVLVRILLEAGGSLRLPEDGEGDPSIFAVLDYNWASRDPVRFHEINVLLRARDALNSL